MTGRVQAQAVAIEWRRMADLETYYPLRDGPRLQRGGWVITTQERYLPADQVMLAKRLAGMHEMIHNGYGRGQGEAMERVQGGDSNATREARMEQLSALIREMAGYQGAALRVGKDGYGCFGGICRGDTQATIMQRIGYPHGSLQTFRRLVQQTMQALQDHADGLALDTESFGRAYSRA